MRKKVKLRTVEIPAPDHYDDGPLQRLPRLGVHHFSEERGRLETRGHQHNAGKGTAHEERGRNSRTCWHPVIISNAPGRDFNDGHGRQLSKEVIALSNLEPGATAAFRTHPQRLADVKDYTIYVNTGRNMYGN